jgi:hypothetical protein
VKSIPPDVITLEWYVVTGFLLVLWAQYMLIIMTF